jgi:hypothetical protein
MDLARVAIAIDTTPAQEGLRGLSQGFGQVKSSATATHQVLGQGSALVQKLATSYTELGRTSSAAMKQLTQAQQVAVAQTDAFANRLKAQQAAFKEQQLRGAISPAQAQQLGEAAAAAYNRGVLRVLDRGNAQGAFQGRQGLAVYTQIASSLKDAGQQAEKAAGGFGRLQGPLQNLLLNLTGLPGPLGKVAVGLSTFAVGGVLTIGIAAAGAAVGALIGNIIERHRQQREEVDKLIAKYADLKKIVQVSDLKSLERQESAQRSLVAGLSKGKAIETSSGVRAPVVDVGKLREEIIRLGEIQAAIAGAKKAARDDALSAQANEIAGVRTLIDLGKASTADLAKRTALVAALTAERAKEGVTFERRVQIETQLNQLANAGKKNADESVKAADERLNSLKSIAAAERELAVLNAQGVSAAVEQAAQKAIVNARIDETVAGLKEVSVSERDAFRVLLESVAQREEENRLLKEALDLDIARTDQLRRFASEQSDFLDKLSASSGKFQDRAFGRSQKVKLDPATFGIDDALAALIAKAQETREKFVGLFQDGFEAIFTKGIAGFKDFFQQILQLGLRAAAAIAAAFAVKQLGLDKLGAGGSSNLGGLLSKFGAVGKAIPVIIVGFAAGAAVGAGTSNRALGTLGGAATGAATGAAIGSVIPGIGTLAGGIIGGIAGGIGGLLGSSKKRRQEQAEREAARQSVQSQIDDFIKSVGPDESPIAQALKGLEEKFTALSAQAKKLGLDTAGLESAYAAASAKIRDEFAKLQSLFGQNLEVRALAAEGDQAGSESLRRRLADEAEVRAAEQQGFGAATIARLLEVQALERQADALAKVKEAADEAARAQAAAADRALRQADLAGDLGVRRLAAIGATKDADDYRRKLEQEREIREALTNGITDANLEMLKLVQTLESQAIAAQRATEETRALADLEVRRLQATGDTAGADQRRFELEQERERLDAISSGKSAAFLEQLIAVQKLEASARVRANIDDVFSVRNPDFTGSRNTVAEARTITATQADSGIALMRTMSFFLERIEYNTRSSGGGAGSTGTITFTPNDNDLAAGVTRQSRTLGTRPTV